MATVSPIVNWLFMSVTLILFLSNAETAIAKMNKTELIIQILDGHNAARTAVGVPPLVWSESLSEYARIYSSTERRKDCKLIHSPGSGFGENLFWGQGKHWEPKDAVAAWLEEKKWYTYENNSCSGPECGHYTQIVWRETMHVGCSKIKCDTGDIFITCEYHPPGNYIGEKPY